jgi:hypothetical protein
MTAKKYVINVDFWTSSKVHLNPPYFGKMWCRLNEEKKSVDGGKVYATAEEARRYLDGRETLLFKGRAVENLVKCVNCSNRAKQSVHWDL